MTKYENTVFGMLQLSDIVYVDGKTIKDRHKLEEYSDEESTNIMKNIDDYYIIFYNSDSSKGDRVLKLSSKLFL